MNQKWHGLSPLGWREGRNSATEDPIFLHPVDRDVHHMYYVRNVSRPEDVLLSLLRLYVCMRGCLLARGLY